MVKMMCLKGMNLSKSSKALVCPIILFIILVTPLVPKQIVQPGAFGAQGQLLRDAMALQGAGGGRLCWTKPTHFQPPLNID